MQVKIILRVRTLEVPPYIIPKKDYFPDRNSLQIFPQRVRFGRLQNGISPFRAFDASHSLQSVCRLHVNLGQGQSSRTVGDMGTRALAGIGLTFLNRGAKVPSFPEGRVPITRS